MITGEIIMTTIQKLHANIKLLESETSTLNESGRKMLYSALDAQTHIEWQNKSRTILIDIEVLTKKLHKITNQLTNMNDRFKEAGDVACDHNSDGYNPFR